MFFFICSLVLSSFFPAIPDASAGETPLVSPDSKNTSSPAAPGYTRTTTQIVVTVTVNTVSKGDLFAELDDQGNLFIKTEDLDALKLQFPAGSVVVINGERFVPANAVLDVTSSFDEKKLALSFVGKTTESQKTTFDVFSLQPKPKNVYYPRETSAFVNYGLNYAYTDPLGFQSFSAKNKIGIHSGDVFFTSDSLYTQNKTDDKFVRLQSTATYERRDDLQWFVLGDQFANSGDLGSAINMGGIGFSKVYKLDPYFITQPAFDLTGSVIYPTQAEVYSDGVLVGKQQIAPGSFDLKNIYSYTGQHNVVVVLKDPFGHEQRIAYPLYFNTQMLREGLHEYSYNVGFIRQDYGVKSDEYDKAAFSAFHRYGVTSSLNIGARAEGSDGIYNGGVFTAFTLPHLGAFTVSVAESSAHAAQDGHGEQGHAVSLQHSYQIGTFSTNVALRQYSRDYATVGARPSPDMARYLFSGSVGASLPVGGISAGYSGTETYSGQKTRMISANYSRSISKSVSFFTTASETHQTGQSVGRTDDYSIFVGLNINFDNNLHAALQYNKTTDTNAESMQIQKDVPVGEGLGYRALLNHSDSGNVTTNSFNPFIQYNGRYGIYAFDSTVQNSAGKTSELYSLSTAGSFVYAGGFFGVSRPVSDSFSVVMLDDAPNAKVLNNGQQIGTTSSSGTVVVPTLTSYGQNLISVDVKDLPMDYSISGVTKALSPSLWSGSCVAFDAVKMQAVTGSLFVRINGEKVPLEYVEISLEAGNRKVTAPTGRGGEFYLENTLPKEAAEGGDQMSCRAIAERRKTGGGVIKPGSYYASVDYQGRKCIFRITFPQTEDVITDIGPIVCQLEQPAAQPEEKTTETNKPSGDQISAPGEKAAAPLAETSKSESKQPVDTPAVPVVSGPAPAEPASSSQVAAAEPAMQCEPSGTAALVEKAAQPLPKEAAQSEVKLPGQTKAAEPPVPAAPASIPGLFEKASAPAGDVVANSENKLQETAPPAVNVPGVLAPAAASAEKTSSPETTDEAPVQPVLQTTAAPGEKAYARITEAAAGPEAGIEDNPPHSFVVSVNFKKGVIAGNTKKTLDSVVQILRQNPGFGVEIQVSGDRHGTEEATLRLGLKKADEIAHYLRSAGVKADRIRKIECTGKMKLLCHEPTTACDNKNRRGIIRIIA